MFIEIRGDNEISVQKNVLIKLHGKIPVNFWNKKLTQKYFCAI